ncbi:hypothetical protein GMDG_00223 [Pseudogymnoascus destructans 20631-21]|uniref:Uncharacterized protein n=1 Tax=Pseudogymnoascus destructans (strain ATCC MYA-4855 / 20631-21) TaxID=658429 RepID=L8FZ21_PSED2|nr:hypothetical protein GMDG_00223 [Pseudogymnoascus destructans 20631-21]
MCPQTPPGAWSGALEEAVVGKVHRSEDAAEMSLSRPAPQPSGDPQNERRRLTFFFTTAEPDPAMAKNPHRGPLATQVHGARHEDVGLGLDARRTDLSACQGEGDGTLAASA